MEPKERTKEYNRKYYQENKAKWYEKHLCYCGGKYMTANWAKHYKTKRHKMYRINQEMKPMEDILKLKLFV